MYGKEPHKESGVTCLNWDGWTLYLILHVPANIQYYDSMDYFPLYLSVSIFYFINIIIIIIINY